MYLPIKHATFHDTIRIFGCSENKYTHDGKVGLRLGLLDNGFLLIELPGFQDILIGPACIKELIVLDEWDYRSGKAEKFPPFPGQETPTKKESAVETLIKESPKAVVKSKSKK
jgi:hypothetical protein